MSICIHTNNVEYKLEKTTSMLKTILLTSFNSVQNSFTNEIKLSIISEYQHAFGFL